MKIEVIRTTFTSASTMGKMAIDGVFQCWTLEPAKELRLFGPIPKGDYVIHLRHSEKFHRKVPGLLNVPGRTDIEIHIGNAAKDTRGCILVGKTKATNFVGNSREAFDELFDKIQNALDRSEVVEIQIRETATDENDAAA